ncbi:3-phosphoglycerate dehydrogenase [bacterium LRH843]|nr:3-phosphoglycerate dehydrogenase [bacterium LRH843]
MNIVYLDPVNPELRNLIIQNNPRDASLTFAAEMSAEEYAKEIENADYIVVATAPVSADLIQKARRLKHIQKTGIGVDNIDLAAAKEREITVSNTPGANANGVAELSILMILSLYRKLSILNASTKNGDWQMWEHRMSSYELNGKTHGLLGFGHIGQETAKRSKSFGTNIIYHDVQKIPAEQEEKLEARYVTKKELLEQADIISLHIPYLPETKNFIDQEELSQMKKTAILINVSRGGIVNEKALAEALRNEEIGGAGIDVWTEEPPSPSNPLFSFEQVIATPHIGAGTKDTLNRVLEMAFENIIQIEAGQRAAYVVTK